MTPLVNVNGIVILELGPINNPSLGYTNIMNVPGEVVFSKTWSSWAAASLFMATILAEKVEELEKGFSSWGTLRRPQSLCPAGRWMSSHSFWHGSGMASTNGQLENVCGNPEQKSQNRPFHSRTHGGKK